MDYSKVMNQVLILFFIMLIGFYARKRKIIDNGLNKGLIELLLRITLPLMIIASFDFSFSMEMFKKASIIFLCSLVIHSLLVLAGKLLYKNYNQNEASVLKFIMIFSNCGFMGYPIIDSIYGKTGVFYTAIYNIVFNVFLWTIGVMLFTKKKDFRTIKKELLNPGIVSVLIGLVLFVFSIKLPIPIQKTFEIVGGTTTPLSMIIIGTMLADIKIKDLFSGAGLYLSTFFRLLITPIVVLVVLKFIGLKGMNIGIPVIISGMPAAANTAILAEKYGENSEFASKCIFFSTLLSTLTIPILILFMKWFIK